MNYLYGLWYDDPEPKCLYIGVTTRTVEERFKEHYKGMCDPGSTKDLYFHIRQKGIDPDRVYPTLVAEIDDGLDTDQWEDFWVFELITAGHPLQNSIRGNKRIAKKRGESLNLLKQAEASYEQNQIVEEWYERRGGKMVQIDEPTGPRKSQKLTESIRAPMLEEFIDADWKKFDKNWEFFKWDGYMIKRRQLTKKKRQVRVENIKTKRKLDMFDHECSGYNGLYTRVLDNWTDDGWGTDSCWEPLR